MVISVENEEEVHLIFEVLNYECEQWGIKIN